MLGSREQGKDESEHGTLADPPRQAARKERAESGSGFASFVFHTLAFLSSAELQEKKTKNKYLCFVGIYSIGSDDDILEQHLDFSPPGVVS